MKKLFLLTRFIICSLFTFTCYLFVSCHDNPWMIELTNGMWKCKGDHSLGGPTNIIAATCTAAGSQTGNCTRPECGETGVTNILPARGHAWAVTTINAAATCIHNRFETWTCTREVDGSVCGTVDPARDNIEIANTATGVHTLPNGVCGVCGVTVSTVTSAAEYTAAIAAIASGGNGKHYEITVPPGVQIDVPGVTDDNSFGSATGCTLTLTGGGTIQLDPASTGRLFHVGGNNTLIIDGPTLQGHGTNGDPLVHIRGGSNVVELKNGKIIGNNSGGVLMNGGDFIMSGGEISGTREGVHLNGTCRFIMSGGIVRNNTGSYGAGVLVRNGGNFYMSGGIISGNTSTNSGAGVRAEGTVRISGGIIYGGEANAPGIDSDGYRLANVASGNSFFNNATAQHGTWSGDPFTSTWTSNGNIASTNVTIHVIGGVLQ